MVGDISPLRGFFAPSGDSSPGMIGFEGRESIVSHLKNGKPIAEKLVKVLGGDVCAFSEMVGRISLLREFSAPSADLSPGVIRFEGRESLLSFPKNGKPIRGEVSAPPLVRDSTVVGNFGIAQSVSAPGLREPGGQLGRG